MPLMLPTVGRFVPVLVNVPPPDASASLAHESIGEPLMFCGPLP